MIITSEGDPNYHEKKFNSPLFQNKQRLLVGIPCNPDHLSRVQNANSCEPGVRRINENAKRAERYVTEIDKLSQTLSKDKQGNLGARRSVDVR